MRVKGVGYSSFSFCKLTENGEIGNMLALPTAGAAVSNVLTPTGQSALASSLIGSAPLSTSLGVGASHGPQMFLRIRVNDNADAAHVSTTIPV
jgi:target of rapamycin complex 2 subunit MAPKAP1